MRVALRSVLPALMLLVVACGGTGTEPGDARNSTSTASLAQTTSSLAATTTTGHATPATSSPSTNQPIRTTTSGPQPATTTLPSSLSMAEVVRVVDGDTIAVRLETGTIETLRLIGINSPEGGECFAIEAGSGLAGLIDRELVYLEPDVSDRDQFGRLLRYVWTTDGRLVNVVTVEEGWALARDYPPDTARSGQLQAAEERARGSGRGLWAPDACGAPLPAEVRITEVEYDAEGIDNFNLNGEWVVISNADDVPVELTGWVLKDESATHRYVFPVGFTLAPGSSVRLFTGCGVDSDRALYWCVSGSAVWNNSGDTAFLLDPEGNIVHSLAYE